MIKKDAKDIACHFVDKAEIRATPTMMGKTINQAKSLLNSNYTKEEVIKVIDYLVDQRNINMYSLGYINTCIHQVLNEVNVKEQKEKADKLKYKIKTQGVESNGKSTDRNNSKLSQFGIQSRFRKKLVSDLFEDT